MTDGAFDLPPHTTKAFVKTEKASGFGFPPQLPERLASQSITLSDDESEVEHPVFDSSYLSNSDTAWGDWGMNCVNCIAHVATIPKSRSNELLN